RVGRMACGHEGEGRAVVPGERVRLAHAGRVAASAVLRRLAGLVGVEAPDASVVLEERAWHLPGHAGLPIVLAGRLTRVRWGADVHVEATTIIERETLGPVPRLIRERHDRLCRSRRFQLAFLPGIANDPRVLPEIDVAGSQRDASAAFGCERLAEVELAVAVGVAERDDRAGRAFGIPSRDEEIAVGGNRHLAADAHIVRSDQGAEPGRKRDRAV